MRIARAYKGALTMPKGGLCDVFAPLAAGL